MAAQLFSTAPRTVTVSSTSFQCGTRWWLVIDVTAIAATPVVTVSIEIFDNVSQKWIKVWTAAATLVAVGTNLYLFTDSVDPIAASEGITEVKEFYGAQELRLTMTHADTDSITYSASALNIPGF
ncbi:MAG: hypothetical protein V3S43_03490 [Acidimicrobiia bacterium]